MSNLPAHLQNRATKNLNEVAVLGIGAALPPHISIRGNTFTAVDASGAEMAIGPTLDVCVTDISDVVCKQYYGGKPWTPDSNEPPVCWSANGLAPSRDSVQPQSPLCANCQWNVRGSAVSAISGAAIKACRDEKWLAVMAPSALQYRFQLRLTPGSFKNWREYLEKCKGSQTDLSNVITRMTFEPKTNGVLLFQALSYIDEATANARDAGYAEKAFDLLVGRNDVPIQGALPAPTAQSNAALPLPAASAPIAASPQPQPFMALPGAGAAPVAPSASGNGAEPAAPRRRRRTHAEIAADNAPAAPGFAQSQPASTTIAPIAPFRPAPAAQPSPFAPATAAAAPTPAAPAPSAGAQFGIRDGVTPNAEIQGVLNNLFAPK